MSTHDQYIELSSLPEEVRKKVLAFISDLMEKWNEKRGPSAPLEKPKGDNNKKRVFGIAKGMATMTKDFDAPLDDFKEYME